MFDAIIVKPLLAKQNETDPDDHVEYWIDVHEGDAQDLVKHLKRYAIRKKGLFINDISNIIKPFALQTPNGIEYE